MALGCSSLAGVEFVKHGVLSNELGRPLGYLRFFPVALIRDPIY